MATLQEPQLDLEAANDLQSGSCGSSEESNASTTEISGMAAKVAMIVVDVESGGDCCGECSKVHFKEVEKDCRICHLSLDVNSQESENGIAIELGCSCKDDLAVAHKKCAEAWFKIKGNRTCEICGSTARNIAGGEEAELIDQWNETNGPTPSRATAPNEYMTTSETRNFWQGHRFLNFLLASMVFAFVISWLFHFNVPS